MPTTITYSPQIPLNAADITHVDTCDTRRCTSHPAQFRP